MRLLLGDSIRRNADPSGLCRNANGADEDEGAADGGPWPWCVALLRSGECMLTCGPGGGCPADSKLP